MKLFEIHDRIEHILSVGTDMETGEITEEALTALDELEEAKSQKVLACAAYLKGERCEAEAIEAEAARLKARAEIHYKRAERLRRYIQHNVNVGEKFSDARSEVKWIHSKRVQVPDITKLSEEYLRRKEVVEPDKTRLRKALKDGAAVSGAWLEPHDSLVVK